jgi:osmotically-inducible protein OsmY
MTMTKQSTDHDLKVAVERELDWAAEVRNDRVGVSINDGAVTLSGQVESYPEKSAAVDAALRVRGVTAIADEIEVRHSRGIREDADIAREAAAALRNTVAVPTDSVKVTVHNQQITLVGEVAWQYQRAAARHTVAAIPGVTGVTDSIKLKPLVPMIASDDARANVMAALRRNAQLAADRIRVDVIGSEVRLTGMATTWTERHQAEYAAWCTPGVTHVENRITIKP